VSTRTPSKPVEFTLRVPPSWFEFDIWRATRTGDLARLVDGRIATDPRLRPWRGALLKALREAAEQAEREGAVLCAAMTDPVARDAVLAAVLTVFSTHGALDDADNTAEAIAGQITATAPTSGARTWRQVEIVDLAAGRAVRVRGVDVARLGDRAHECVVMQTLIPVPDRGGVVDVVLASPQIQLTESMLDLFEAVSDTFAWTRHGTSGAENGAVPINPEGQ
jgi:hypothetical protein